MNLNSLQLNLFSRRDSLLDRLVSEDAEEVDRKRKRSVSVRNVAPVRSLDLAEQDLRGSVGCGGGLVLRHWVKTVSASSYHLLMAPRKKHKRKSLNVLKN